MPTKKNPLRRPADELARMLMSVGRGRYSTNQILRDFVELSALAISNSVDCAQFDAREAQYLATIKRYDRGEAKLFAEMLGQLIFALEETDQDIFVPLIAKLEIPLNSRWGQVMTPWSISSMMARMQLGTKTEIEAMIAERGFITMSDPACGVGNMAIAFAFALRENGFNFQQVLHATIQDIDPFMSQCAYVQCSLFGMPAIVTTGDSLRMTESACWFTPIHVTGGWNARLRGDNGVMQIKKFLEVFAEVEQLLASEPAEPKILDQPVIPLPGEAKIVLPMVPVPSWGPWPLTVLPGSSPPFMSSEPPG
jgi:hypothetical protein